MAEQGVLPPGAKYTTIMKNNNLYIQINFSAQNCSNVCYSRYKHAVMDTFNKEERHFLI